MVHHFQEMVNLQDIVVPANNTTAGVLSVNLNQLVNANSYKGLFDLYKINGCKFTFLYRANSSDVSNGLNTASLPVLYTAINRDPFCVIPGSVSDILNDDTSKIHRADGLLGKGGVYVKCPKPDMSVAIEGGNVPQQWNYGVSKKFQPWLTTGGAANAIDQSNVPHFGIRYFLDNMAAASTQSIQVYVTLYFAMKEQD